MRKLMAMIGMVAMAFGLSAEEAFKYNQTDFTDTPVGQLDISKNDAGGDTAPFYWAGAPGESEVKARDDGSKYLSVYNSDPLYRTVNPRTESVGPAAQSQPIGTGVFVDMVVTFSPCEAEGKPAEMLYNRSKIGICTEVDDASNTTNLVVYAASLVKSAFSPSVTNFVIAVGDDFNFDSTNRVTIRVIDEISEAKLGMAGFVIFVNGEPVSVAEDDDYDAKIGRHADFFNNAAKPFYDKRQLFVSMVTAGTDNAQKIYGVGFKGMGELDYVKLTDLDNAPEFAQPGTDVTIAWDEGVTGYTYTLGDADPVVVSVTGAGSTNITLPPGTLVKISDVVADNYVDGGIVGEKMTKTDEGWRFEAAGATLTLKAAPVTFTVGDEKFATFEDALAAAGPGGTITLARDCDEWSGEVEIDIGEGNEIFFDLAGKTISATDYDDYDLFYVMSGKLTVIGSDGGGKIAVEGKDGSSYVGIIYADNGGMAQIGLDADDDKGVVVVDALIGEAGDLTIFKGMFINTLNSEEALKNYLPSGGGYKVVPEGNYWEVQKADKPEYPEDWPATDAATKAKFDDWVAGKGKDADLATEAAQKAFLLNCAVIRVTEEEAVFKITKIENVEGEWVISVTEVNTDGEPFNGEVVIKAYEEADCKTEKEPTGEETKLFWKAFLVFPSAE